MGYAVTNDEDIEAFRDAYRARVSAAPGLAFDSRLIARSGEDAPGSIPEGGNVLYMDGHWEFVLFRLRERFGQDSGIPDADQAEIPVLIERPENPVPTGGNVLFMDGHVEFIRYPGKWPMTETTIGVLESLAGP